MAIRNGSLVLYKNHPAVVLSAEGKLELQLPDAARRRVRAKDVQLLHPGPVGNLGDVLTSQEAAGWVETAWELLQDQQTTLADLSELAHGTYTPATAWATWQTVSQSLLFDGTPDRIATKSAAAVESERQRRAEREAADRARSNFITHLQSAQLDAQDEPFLRELEKQALGQQSNTRALRALGRSESAENAHAVLLEVGFWDAYRTPYAERHDLPTGPPNVSLEPLPEEQRLDLTHLTALAIDDEGNRDPDDALSLEPGRLWVHIADVAARVTPDTPADLEARARGSNLYLPDGTVPMLPTATTEQLALGLEEVSPALSFGLDLQGGEITNLDIRPSWVRVQRMTYAEADQQLESEPLDGLYELAQEMQACRWADGAIMIDWPEARIRVDGGVVSITPIRPMRSRDLVSEAMLAVGSAVARYALEQQIPIPFSTQDPPQGSAGLEEGLAGMFALRKSLKRSVIRTTGGSHAGLGLEAYTQATSPLRRYGDLLVHQQLRAHIRQAAVLDPQHILERVAVADAVVGSVRRTERLSNRHWTLVFLEEHPGWTGRAVVIDKRDRLATILVRELVLETTVHLPTDLPLNSEVEIALTGVDLPRLEPYFQVLG